MYSYVPLLDEQEIDDYYPDLLKQLKKLSRPLKGLIGKHLTLGTNQKRLGSVQINPKQIIKSEKITSKGRSKW